MNELRIRFWHLLLVPLERAHAYVRRRRDDAFRAEMRRRNALADGEEEES